MEGRYSTRSPAVKRLMKEAQELCEPTDQYFAQPLEDNLFEWHFTIRGPADSDFQAGVYHGRIILPVDYPMKPPSIMWLTPNGRFETNKKICLSISGHHPESWQPSWSIRTALLAIIGFMPTHPSGAIGSLDYKPEERKALAKKSRDWKCPVCGDISEILLEPSPESSQTSQEAKELATQISFQGEKPKPPPGKSTDEAASTTSPSPPCTPSVPVAEGVSNDASILRSSTPLNGIPSTGATIHNPGAFYPPWPGSPVAPACNTALPPPFMYYPWSSHVLANGGHGGGIAAQIPRFPYPPSHYAYTGNTSFYPPGCAGIPCGMGMFPCPFPPPLRTVPEQNLTGNRSVSINNSSASSPNRSQNTGSNSQSPDMPSVPDLPPPSSASGGLPPSSSCSPLKEDVLSELLNSVKHVGSEEPIQLINNTEAVILANSSNRTEKGIVNDESVLAADHNVTVLEKSMAETGFGLLSSTVSAEDDKYSTKTLEIPVLGRDSDNDQDCSTGFEPYTSRVMDIPTISDALSRAFDVVEGEIESECVVGGAVQVSLGVDHALIIGDHCHAEDNIDKSQATDTDMSVSPLKKESLNESTGMEISHSELLADAGEDALYAVELSDTEQRSNFERSTSSSMPDLKKKLGNIKGLRQRQSATGHVPADVTGGDQIIPEHAIIGGGRQRIEAVSGDSSSANQRFHNGVHVGNDAGHNHANEVQHLNRRQPGRQVQSTYDVSFLVMVGLCLATIVIILNRIFYMVDFSDIFY